MADVDHQFPMQCGAAEAQALFVRDVVPALHRVAEFHEVREQPGELHLSDARELAPLSRDKKLYDSLSSVLARGLKVGFTAGPTGTLVSITGHAEGEVRDAIDELGTPGHWPETANDPRD